MLKFKVHRRVFLPVALAALSLLSLATLTNAQVIPDGAPSATAPGAYSGGIMLSANNAEKKFLAAKQDYLLSLNTYLDTAKAKGDTALAKLLQDKIAVVSPAAAAASKIPTSLPADVPAEPIGAAVAKTYLRLEQAYNAPGDSKKNVDDAVAELNADFAQRTFAIACPINSLSLVQDSVYRFLVGNPQDLVAMNLPMQCIGGVATQLAKPVADQIKPGMILVIQGNVRLDVTPAVPPEVLHHDFIVPWASRNELGVRSEMGVVWIAPPWAKTQTLGFTLTHCGYNVIVPKI